MSNKITVFADGSCHNPKGERKHGIKGGYGILLLWNGKKKAISSCRYDFSSNNRMELLAVIEALRHITAKRGYEIEIISDSNYVIRALTEKWLFSWEEMNFIGRKNEDLWRQFLIEYRKFRPEDLTFTWVRGHDGNFGNEAVDKLAAKGGNSEIIIIDEHD